MKRFIFGLALASIAAMSWAGQNVLVHPSELCKEKSCSAVPEKQEWSFQGKKGGIIYGPISHTFRIHEVPTAIRSAQDTYSGFTAIKLHGGFISYAELKLKDVNDLHAPFLYAFNTPANKLPKKLPFDNDTLGYCYNSKGMLEDGTKLEIYNKKDTTVIVGRHPTKTNVYVLNKDYSDKILHIIFAKDAIKHIDQVLGSLNQDI